ncbi:DEAD/DEAH box helicase family protein [Nocardioides flavescens]|uniref:DEAD/DEAH box helicase family protein n=1 Tax=Nocardioides flavescens TaxID=2691959 RepID=UPI00301CFC8D
MSAPPLRRHQREALDALAQAWGSGRRRAWVALPPGAGKTRVGLETVAARLADDPATRAVVLGPNTAIQGQWVAQARAAGLDVGTDRALEHPVTALTYQAVATFDPDVEGDDADTDDGGGTALVDRLHPNGRALVERLREAGPLLLVLDECHHLLEVWGRLLAELLEQVPEATVLGLTATPPGTLTRDQAALVAELFGAPVFAASIPAVVREGDLAPYVELAWLTSPTAAEEEWLGAQAERFQELVTALLAPDFGSVPLLAWLDARFVTAATPWLSLLREEPQLCRAVLRLHHAGLIALPPGARPGEEHRTAPTAEDWVALVDDWLTRRVARSDLPEDERVLEAVRRALPSVGYRWTRAGVRRGRSPVDRVLARSESKTTAVVELCDHEHLALGERLRMLVLCDHERAGATLPADLTGVLDQQAGSAVAVLAALVASPDTARLGPLLVTGSTVAGSSETVAALRDWLPDRDLAAALVLEPLEGATGLVRLAGPWSSRRWVALVTGFFSEGRCRVLVGTRALLGEGWDAPRVTGVVDATTATTSTAVVQTRGRALRLDPAWPDKVAVNFSLVCVSDRHPAGGQDWERLVRKHAGFLGLDLDGQVVDGVAHLDPAFSPFAPPPVAELGAANARAVVRSQQRDEIREQWRIGSAYDDTTLTALRIRPRATGRLGSGAGPAPVVLRPTLTEVRGIERDTRLAARAGVARVVAPLVGVAAGLALAGAGGALLLLGAVVALLGVLLGVGAARSRTRARTAYGTEVLRAAAEPPSVHRIAAAVADALRASGLTAVGAEAVEVVLDHEGEYRCVLRGTDAEAATFATALDEAVGPIGLPRYVLPRHVVLPATAAALDPGVVRSAAEGRLAPDGVVWHAVPSVLGTRAERARAYAAAWDHWVGGGAPVFTGSPEGTGVLAAQQGSDPFAASTVMRRQWT